MAVVHVRVCVGVYVPSKFQTQSHKGHKINFKILYLS